MNNLNTARAPNIKADSPEVKMRHNMQLLNKQINWARKGEK